MIHFGDFARYSVVGNIGYCDLKSMAKQQNHAKTLKGEYMLKCKVIDQTDLKKAEQELQEFLNYADKVISITQSESGPNLTIVVVIEDSEKGMEALR